MKLLTDTLDVRTGETTRGVVGVVMNIVEKEPSNNIVDPLKIQNNYALEQAFSVLQADGFGSELKHPPTITASQAFSSRALRSPWNDPNHEWFNNKLIGSTHSIIMYEFSSSTTLNQSRSTSSKKFLNFSSSLPLTTTPLLKLLNPFSLLVSLLIFLLLISEFNNGHSSSFVKAQNFCKTFSDCTSCVGAADNSCIWCATSDTCVSVLSIFDESTGSYRMSTSQCPIPNEPVSLFTEMCMDPLFETCGNRQLPNIVESNSSILQQQPPFSATHPTQNNNLQDISKCHDHMDCVSDKDCVYISKGFFTVTSANPSEDGKSRVIPLGINGTCWRALPILGAPTSRTVHRGGLVYYMEAEESYYATCVIREVYYWVIIAASVAAIGCCVCTGCICCLCCFCLYCKRDRRYISLNS
ncbi:hypothetical protein C9374_011284 [Naegleria lovaniensis]|uniref:PSI domain-containing protein n=1 Tax=Naegleria lovaniensis TaxID=51637 RepID=A0AA88KRC4_NAELO|nr:uncharacterized protein C9374_011284 [Naegleria lovaniensis]KAG2392559.1 hypothetical protein C9374_011284 [Naegleria lovaniensis]